MLIRKDHDFIQQCRLLQSRFTHHIQVLFLEDSSSVLRVSSTLVTSPHDSDEEFFVQVEQINLETVCKFIER